MALSERSKALLKTAQQFANESIGEENVNKLKEYGKTATEIGVNVISKAAKATVNSLENYTHNEESKPLSGKAPDSPIGKNIFDESKNEHMTQFIAAICPQCGASLEVENGIDSFFCKYCGNRIVLTNQSDEVIKAKTTAKRLEHREAMADKMIEHLNKRKERQEQERQRQQKNSNKTILGCFIVIAVCMIAIFTMNHVKERKSQAEEAMLQTIVDQIELDIKNEEYESALAKANNLYYTTGYSSEIKRKWNNTRKSLIEQITEKQKALIVPTASPAHIQKPNSTTKPKTNTPVTNKTSMQTQSLSYTTNDKETAKKGNTGVFSYRRSAGSYYQYYIIDFDEGYVYYFCEGNGSETCDRVKIESGDLNSVLIITYHDGGDQWSYGLHFSWKNNPEHLVLQDVDGSEYDYYTTDLDDALALRDQKNIYDY